MKNHLSLTVLLTLTASLLLSCKSIAPVEEDVSSYAVELPKQRQLTELHAFSGDYRAAEYSQIVSETDGKIATIFVKDGQKVSKGQPLFELDSVIALFELETAQKEYDQAVDNALQLTRYNKYPNTQSIELAQMAIDATRNNLHLAKKRMELTIIRAPFDGKLGQINVSEGNLIQEGEELTELVSVQSLELHFSAPKELMAPYSQHIYGRPYLYPKVSILSKNNDYIDGELKYVAPTTLGTVEDKLGAYAVFDNTENGLFIGSTTQLYLNSLQQSDLLLVPESSIHQNGENTQVYVVDENFVVLSKTVETTLVKERFHGYVAIKSGLSAEDFVLTSSQAHRFNGRKIHPNIDLMSQLNEVMQRAN